METPVPFANTRAHHLDINNSMIKKLTAKTVDEIPAFCQRWISRKEIQSAKMCQVFLFSGEGWYGQRKYCSKKATCHQLCSSL